MSEQGNTKVWRLANVQRNAPAGGSSGGPSAWFAAHKRETAIGGAVAGVAALALLRRRRAGQAGTPAAAAGAAAPTVDGAAGLVAPDTSATDIQNAVQDQLNSALEAINGQLSNPTAATSVPATASSTTPVPRPGKGLYLIKPGDTLAKIAMAVYGTADHWALADLRTSNPVLSTFGAQIPLNFFVGHTLTIGAPTPTPATPTRQPLARPTTTTRRATPTPRVRTVR